MNAHSAATAVLEHLVSFGLMMRTFGESPAIAVVVKVRFASCTHGLTVENCRCRNSPMAIARFLILIPDDALSIRSDRLNVEIGRFGGRTSIHPAHGRTPKRTVQALGKGPLSVSK